MGKLRSRFMGGYGKPRILVVTACGKKKHDKPMPAWRLYKSSRIRAVYNRRCGCDFAILSAKYGLIGPDQVIAPYERVMTEQRAEELLPEVMAEVRDYDYIIYFRGGARREYLQCIEEACKRTEKKLLALGYANLGGIGDLEEAMELLQQNCSEEKCRI